MNKGVSVIFLFLVSCYFVSSFVVNHNSVSQFDFLTDNQIQNAQDNLHIVYGHASHGSHLPYGMRAIDSYYSSTKYDMSKSIEVDKLHLNWDTWGGIYPDCPDLTVCDKDENSDGYSDWYDSTKGYLSSNPETNVVIWSWCSIDGANAQRYVDTMEQLIFEYPNVEFVFMTGHAQGQGEDMTINSVHYNNELIRNHTEFYNRTLYDFADIEAYNPDGNYFWDLMMTDDLNYTGGNWADEWIAANSGNVLIDIASRVSQCYHSKDLNCAIKGKAAWVLWASIAEEINETGTCVENWICEDWSSCLDGVQNRICTDLNSCGTELNKPFENQGCCVENWTCQGWSSCLDGVQNRTCIDLNSCGTEVSKPVLEQSCSCVENWSCGEWSICINSSQERVCTDLNSCGTESSKPSLEQACSCVESWTCEYWSVCENGFQARVCVDDHLCGTELNRPNESQSCEVEVYLDGSINSSVNFSNMSQEELQNVTNLTFETEKGKIKFKECLNITKSLNLTGKVLIENNRILIDSENLPELNSSAQLEIRDLVFINPRVLRNGEICSNSVCSNVNYNSGVLTFDVSSFSEYSAEEVSEDANEENSGDEGSDSGSSSGGSFESSSDVGSQEESDVSISNSSVENNTETDYNLETYRDSEGGVEREGVSDEDDSFVSKIRSLSRKSRFLILIGVLVSIVAVMFVLTNKDGKFIGKRD